MPGRVAPGAVTPPRPEPPSASWLRFHDLLPESFEPLGGDVSPRTYARARRADGTVVIVASYPEHQRDVFHRFLATTELFENAELRVPKIFASDEEELRMVLEDVGAQTLYELSPRPWAERLPHYLHAADLARRIGELPAAEVHDLNPVLDGAALRRELDQTRDRFWRPQGLLSKPLETRFEAFLDTLCEHIDQEPRCPNHRDYMVRNLVPIPSEGPNQLAILDHQDLRLAPASYDLASLLNDSHFPPSEIEAAILARVLPKDADLLSYRRCAVQRTLKAIGTFAAFAHRGFPKHLPLIPPTLGRCLEQMEQLPEGEGLVGELRGAVVGVDTDR
ncbi:MAG: phosphotransferase [Acidobacteriota bacterium]|nr:phosphotransferase [Acidobacteriota bacterium]